MRQDPIDGVGGSCRTQCPSTDVAPRCPHPTDGSTRPWGRAITSPPGSGRLSARLPSSALGREIPGQCGRIAPENLERPRPSPSNRASVRATSREQAEHASRVFFPRRLLPGGHRAMLAFAGGSRGCGLSVSGSLCARRATPEEAYSGGGWRTAIWRGCSGGGSSGGGVIFQGSSPAHAGFLHVATPMEGRLALRRILPLVRRLSRSLCPDPPPGRRVCRLLVAAGVAWRGVTRRWCR